jgi:tRNA (adenine22-N1)-methyltransferase
MRIKSILNQIIKPSSVVIDVGSDHAQIAIDLLLAKRASYVYNIENKINPYLTTIRNLTKSKCLNYTCNIKANGLDTNLINQRVDYCVIAGIGARTIINILSRKNPNIIIDEYILVPHNQPHVLRAFLVQHDYFIVYEEIVEDKGVYYTLMKVCHATNTTHLTLHQIYFGPYNLLHPSTTFKQMINHRRMLIVKQNLHLLNQHVNQELTLINDYMEA